MLNLFANEQNGFCRGRSCEDHLFTITNVIQNQLNSSHSVYAAFIDLEKAFDWVHQDLLTYKILTIIKGLYKIICVRLNDKLSRRALSAILSKFKTLKDTGYCT